MMIEIKTKSIRPTFFSRLMVAIIIFFIPLSMWFYTMLGTEQIRFGFLTEQINGYISLIILLLLYLGAIKLITWILRKSGFRKVKIKPF